MNKFIKIISIILVVCSLLCVCTACGDKKETASMANTYTLETGDTILVSLDTNDGHKLKSGLPFGITKDDAKISQGTFITIDGYQQYKNLIDMGKEQGYTVLEAETDANGLTYIFYQSNGASGVEYNYVAKISGSNSGFLLTSLASRDEAKDVFNHLTITVQK